MGANVPQILAEDESSYTVQGPDGLPMKIAKTPGTQALVSPGMQAQLAAPPPPPSPSPAPEPMPPTPGPTVGVGAVTLDRANGDMPMQAPVAGQPAQPAVQPEAPKPVDPSAIRFATTPPPRGSVLGGFGDFGMNKGLQRYEKGTTAEAAALAEGDKNTADVLGKYQTDAAAQDADYAARQKANAAAQDAAQKEVDNFKIDRNAFWKNKTTGQKVLAGIGMLLSGAGSGLSGQPNLAIQAIDDGINRNIADQQDALMSKKGAVEALAKKGIDLEKMAAVQGAKLWQEVQVRIQQIAATTQSDAVKAKAEAAIGETAMKVAEFKARIAEMNLAREAKAVGGGRPLPAEQAAKIGDIDASSQAADALLGQWRDKSSFFRWLTQSGREYGDALHLAAQSIGYGLEGGKLTDADVARYEGMLPQNGDSEQRAAAKIANLKAMLERKRNAATNAIAGAGYVAPAPAIKPNFSEEPR